MKKEPAVIVIYHKNCPDGTVAAAIALKKHQKALLFPLGYDHDDKDLEEILGKADGKTLIYAVDCCFGVKEALARGLKITALDHHESIEPEMSAILAENPNFTFIFDNNKSGASLAWDYFFPSKTAPKAVIYAEDYDLWRWKFAEKTKCFNNILSMLVNKPEEVVPMLSFIPKKVMEAGAAIAKYQDSLIDRAVKTDEVEIKVGQHIVKAYNITAFKSEAGNLLSRKTGSTVALFSIDGQEVKISFRGQENQIPSAVDLAMILGGGGHRLASGAEVPLKTFLGMIIP